MDPRRGVTAMLPLMDLTLLIGLAIGVVLNVVILYFVIKGAIKNALIEDRAFQSKVAQLQQAAARTPQHLDADGV